MKVHTETGSVYEFDGDKVRRIGTHDMRRDGEWLRFAHLRPVEIGAPMWLQLEPLGFGNVTHRVTSHVTTIEED